MSGNQRATVALRRALLAWFRREQRALPWRKDRDPYRVWISEAMLQQTRVAAVIPYFERFVRRFPDVRALADAPLDDVLAHWSGLGYYRRARMLHRTAQTIVARHAGCFPAARAELIELPGIGPYTAGAIASIAFDAREPLVDGNVARVFARLFGLAGDPSTKRFQDDLWARAAALLPRTRGAGEWNQALMELGALVCTPREPRCAECPLRAHCVALREGNVALLPELAARRKPIDVELCVLVVRSRARWLVERRDATGRMAGLWQFPTIERGSDGAGSTRLFPRRWPSPVTELAGEPLAALRHSITHHRIRIEVRAGELRSQTLPENWRWCTELELGRMALTGMTRKVLASVIASSSARVQA